VDLIQTCISPLWCFLFW